MLEWRYAKERKSFSNSNILLLLIHSPPRPSPASIIVSLGQREINHRNENEGVPKPASANDDLIIVSCFKVSFNRSLLSIYYWPINSGSTMLSWVHYTDMNYSIDFSDI